MCVKLLLFYQLPICVCVSNKAYECCAPNFVSPRKSCGFIVLFCVGWCFLGMHVALTQNRLYSQIIEGLGVTYMKAVHDTFGNEKPRSFSTCLPFQ